MDYRWYSYYPYLQVSQDSLVLSDINKIRWKKAAFTDTRSRMINPSLYVIGSMPVTIWTSTAVVAGSSLATAESEKPN